MLLLRNQEIAYYFYSKDVYGEYTLYQKLINQYKNNIEGIYIVFDVKKRY